MTRDQFELIARLLRSKGPVVAAVSLVLFDQVDNAEAARRVGVTPQAVHRSTKRFTAMYAEISGAFK